MKFNFSYLILLLLALNVNAQDTPPVISTPPPANPAPLTPGPIRDFNSFKDRLYFGGNVGAWFGTSTYLAISPLVGCHITKEFSMGVTGTYNYFSQRYMGQKYVSTVYGGGAFGRYVFYENFFAQVGFERLSVLDYTSPFLDARAWVDNILLGGGYRQPFSDNGAFVAAIFYNINQTPLSPYPNPIIQIGFNIGL